MGVPPTGEIVARPMVARACGHEQEFQYYAVDKYRAQRLAKFKRTRCPNCVAKLVEEQQRASPPKAEAMKLLPVSTQMTLARREDGVWTGAMTANGVSVETVAPVGAGPQAVVAALARLWVVKAGVNVETEAEEEAEE